ncbi:hypothetical protein BDQ17DRAFT_1314540 [Cyathus striatus]|nr:hypothetical protein BDQ17DRAFT_1314540 [Cyathus striatus]
MSLKCAQCDLPADLILQSCDEKLFHTHSISLAMLSHGFPLTLSPVEREIVKLEETSEVLEILLRFMHPMQEQPDLRELSIELLAGVAQAAEKYLVYLAMQACSLRMQMMIKRYPIEVLAYAAGFDYHDIANEAAPLTMGIGCDEAINKLGLEVFSAWVSNYPL